jgi:hypothetical protein
MDINFYIEIYLIIKKKIYEERITSSSCRHAKTSKKDAAVSDDLKPLSVSGKMKSIKLVSS